MTKKCKNCGRLLADHTLTRLELCKGENDAKIRLNELKLQQTSNQKLRRIRLENELGED